MKNKPPRNAGIISVIIAAVVIIFTYTILGTVDLVYMDMDGKRELYRQKDVNVISEIEIPEGEYVYSSGEKTKELGEELDLKIDIGTTVLMNLISFKWDEMDNVIIFKAK